MKKILCFTIALIMLLGAVSVSAVTEEGNLYSNEFYSPRFEEYHINRFKEPTPWSRLEFIEEKYIEKYIHYSQDATPDESGLHNTTPDYVVVMPTQYGGEPRITFGRLGDYALVCANTGGVAPYWHCVYFTEEDKVFTLLDAYKMYPEKIKHALQYFAETSGWVALCGDADLNGAVNVKDATYLQKMLSGIIPGGNGDRFYLATNINGDSSINVRDVTAIQKYASGIPYKVEGYLYDHYIN